MFYSHEILTSQQYGVATIWLVATIGPRGGGRKVTRKAIQEVNVKKACECIISPGAPMALRLQGNLLYGVSRVFSHQCNYVLSDAEKVQTDMKMFYRLLDQNETDPQAGKARRDQNILQDDPGFVLDPTIPELTLNNDDGTLFLVQSQGSSKVYSQLSPLDRDGNSIISRQSGSFRDINISHSGASSLHLPSPFGPPSSAQKGAPFQSADDFGAHDDLGDLGDLELRIDADGNVLGLVDPFDEPELPPLVPPRDKRDNLQEPQPVQQGEDAEGDVIIVEDMPVPAAVAPNSQLAMANEPEIRLPRERAVKGLLPDNSTTVPRKTIEKWQTEYINNMDEVRKRPWSTSAAQARTNAYQIILGQGIGGVGQCTGIPGFEHPLASLFAGIGLEERIYGLRRTGQGDSRRSASQAFDEDETEQTRRVRPRLEGDAPPDGQGQVGLRMGTAPEMGMEGQPGLDEHMSSALRPWSKTPSVHRGSSTAPPGSRIDLPNRQITSSPRDNMIRPIERHRDLASGGSHRGSDLGLLGDNWIMEDLEVDFVPLQELQLDSTLDEFYKFAQEQAGQHGTPEEGAQQNRFWVDFEKIATPAVHTKAIAAQRFYHTLTLATKSVINLRQNVENNQPFGEIYLGIGMEEQAM